MLNRLRSRTRSQEGFTLIELLVVVLIIGILAAIAIPQFIGQKDKANTAAAVALLRDATVAMESSYTDAQVYPATPAAAVTALALINPSIAYKATTATVPAPKNEVVITASTPDSYAMASTSGNKTYTYTRASTGAVTRACGAGCTW